ncbi:unnamed protein product [Darwinula stevensoni]|uniref:Uncharacterized protein n=1 Tax=Darwinula stevensoni TaxID=69355 RepID=A0A7R8X967_9CRUS|nr:unnamed protein product [Darwinula stevensoni]CAG0890821.1 unnamed protein product [Darwinula stevensoni]
MTLFFYSSEVYESSLNLLIVSKISSEARIVVGNTGMMFLDVAVGAVKADLGSSASGGSVEGASCSSSAGAVSSPSRDSESSGSEDGPHSIPPYPRQHPGPAASLSSSSSSESTGGLQALRTALSKFRVPNPIAIHSKTGSSATKHLDRQQQLKELGHSQPESLAVRYTSFPGCGGRKSRSEGGSARRRRVHSPAPSLRFSTGRPRKPGVPLQASRSPHPHSDPDSTGRDCDCGGRGRSSLAKSHSLGSAENVDASVAGGKRPRSKSAERFQALRINNNNDRKNRNNSERRHHRSRSLEKHSGHRLEGTLLRLELGTRTVYRNYEKRILVEGKEEGDFHLDGEAVVTHIVMPRTPTDSGGPFINKPALGWLHPDTKIANEGITYGVRSAERVGLLGRDPIGPAPSSGAGQTA